VNISIVVVNWRSAQHLRQLIASMRRHIDHDAELVVVENASGDDVAREVRSWPGEAQFIKLDENIGYGGGANRGVEAAAGEAIVLLNPDTELIDRSLLELARFALERRALVGPRILNSDHSPQPSASGPPTGPWPWLGAVVPGRVQPQPLRARTEPWRFEGTVRVSWLSGACISAPAQALRDLGPFDPAIHLYGEDMDLGLRAERAGVPSYFCPHLARVVHHHRGSISQLLPDGPWELIARNRRAVIRRAFGTWPERASQAALLLNLGLRTMSKPLLGQDAASDHTALRAALGARDIPTLPPPPQPLAEQASRAPKALSSSWSLR
jgi:N-acetylglucosaminyl-diphospho-decaprenol L-rhamnosyltransferase